MSTPSELSSPVRPSHDTIHARNEESGCHLLPSLPVQSIESIEV